MTKKFTPKKPEMSASVLKLRGVGTIEVTAPPSNAVEIQWEGLGSCIVAPRHSVKFSHSGTLD